MRRPVRLVGQPLVDLTIALSLIIAGGCFVQSDPSSLSLECTNPAPVEHADALITIDLAEVRAGWPSFRAERAVIFDGGVQLPTQAVIPDGDGGVIVATVAAFKPHQAKKLTLRELRDDEERTPHPKNTQAVLAVKTGYTLVNGEYTGGTFTRVPQASIPDGHFAHDAYFKFEGPGWESDRVGYRLYLDSRNRIDIFGKKVHTMVLQDVGNADLVSNHRESYTKEEAWGLDMFRVGESFGIGSFALWEEDIPQFVSVVDQVDCRIAADGDVYSAIQLNYTGWHVGTAKRNLTAVLSITAGSRLTKVDLSVDGTSPEFCTGLAAHEGTEFMSDKGGSGGAWGYIALYGNQTLIGDKLGIALFYDPSDLVAAARDTLSHIVRLRSAENSLVYYAAAAWEQESGGIASLEEFRSYLRDMALLLGNPIQVSITHPSE